MSNGIECDSCRTDKMWESVSELVGVELNTYRGKEFTFEIWSGNELMLKNSDKLVSGRLALGSVKINPNELYVIVEGIKAPISKTIFFNAYDDIESMKRGNFYSNGDMYNGLDSPSCIEHKGSTYIWAIFNELGFV